MPRDTPASPLVQQWNDHLRGRKVTRMDSDASDGSGYSDRWRAYLCADGTFHYRSRSRMVIDAGGVTANSSSDESFTGTWRIVEHGGQAVLQYQRAELAGTDQGVSIALDHRDGRTYFDGAPVYVTDDNELCR